MNSTPETDAVYNTWAGHEDLDVRLLPLCRKLERERDEWMFNYKKANELKRGFEQLAADAQVERDQLRKVCDELAERLNAISNYHAGTAMSESARRLLADTYNQLPHVKDKTK